MRFIFRAMDVRKAIFHCQAYAYSVTCLTDSPGTLICFIGVSRQYHLLPESFNRGWFTELLLLFGSLSGKVAASSPDLLVISVCPKSGESGFLKECVASVW